MDSSGGVVRRCQQAVTSKCCAVSYQRSHHRHGVVIRIEEAWTEAGDRWCLWNVKREVADNLQGLTFSDQPKCNVGVCVRESAEECRSRGQY